MKVTIETINDKKCTVIRRPFDAEWVKGQLDMNNSFLVETHKTKGRWSILWDWECSIRDVFKTPKTRLFAEDIDYTITILPALREHPKPEDAKRLYRYMAEGFTLVTTDKEQICGWDYALGGFVTANVAIPYENYRNPTNIALSHALDEQGNCIEIAIEGE